MSEDAAASWPWPWPAGGTGGGASEPIVRGGARDGQVRRKSRRHPRGHYAFCWSESKRRRRKASSRNARKVESTIESTFEITTKGHSRLRKTEKTRDHTTTNDDEDEVKKQRRHHSRRHHQYNSRRGRSGNHTDTTGRIISTPQCQKTGWLHQGEPQTDAETEKLK